MTEPSFYKERAKLLSSIPEEFHFHFCDIAEAYSASFDPKDELFFLKELISDNFKLALAKYSDRIMAEAIKAREDYETSGV